MSYAPQSLLAVRAYLKPLTGLSNGALGIVGDPAHGNEGYHVGWDRLSQGDGYGDYSASGARDRAGMSNAASALDIGNFPRLRELTRHLRDEARAGRLPDVREIIGSLDGRRVIRWSAERGWSDEYDGGDLSHLTHTHVSYYRDSESRDKTAVYKRFFEGDDMSWTEPLTGGADAGGKTYRAQDWLIGTNVASWGTRAEVGALRAEVSALKGELAAVRADLAKIAVGGVDVTALAAALQPLIATAVADELTKRLAS